MKRGSETLQRVLVGVMGTFIFGSLLVFGYVGAGMYAAMPLVERTMKTRFAGGLAFLMLLPLFMLAAYGELFGARDIPLLLTMPLTDRQRFHRKVAKVVPLTLLAAAPCIAFTTFAYRLHWPLRSFAGIVVAALLVMAVLLGIGFVVALSRWLRLVLRVLAFLGFVLLIVVIVLLFRAPDETMARMQTAGASLQLWLVRWWPGVLAMDLVRYVTFGSWLPAAIAAAKLLLMAQVTFVVAEVLATYSYGLEDVLREQTPLSRRDGSETAVWTEGALARWLRARWSPRTRELLAFIQRREYPEDVGRRARSLLIVLAILIGGTWAARSLPNVRTACLLIIAALVLINLVVDLMHVPLTTRYPSLASRGNHDHPLIETWPVGAREFVRLMWANDFVTLASYVMLMLAAGALLPVSFLAVAFLVIAVPWLLFTLVFMSPLQHALNYHTDVRRRRLLAFLRAVAKVALAIASFFLVSGVLFLASPPPWLAILIMVIIFFVVFVGGGTAAYWIVLARDRKHRFDAEYSRLTGFGSRW